MLVSETGFVIIYSHAKTFEDDLPTKLYIVFVLDLVLSRFSPPEFQCELRSELLVPTLYKLSSIQNTIFIQFPFGYTANMVINKQGTKVRTAAFSLKQNPHATHGMRQKHIFICSVQNVK